MYAFDNSEDRFGSAGFADAQHLARLGFNTHSHNGVLVGFNENGPIYVSDAGGIVTVGGARSGKGACVLGYTVAGGPDVSFGGSKLIIDPKSELASISRGCAEDGIHAIYCLGRQSGIFPEHRVNPFSYLKLSSSTLVSDTKVACEQLVPLSGSPNAQFFERRGQQFMEAIMLTIAERDGVVTPPALFDAISLAAKPSDRWLDFAFLMSESRFPIARQIEEEIAEGHSNASNSAFQGILGELFKAVACLSDPALMAALSPPYDFDFEQLVTSDQRYNVYLCPPAEFVEAWAPMLKALLTCAMIYKSRAPSAPRQLWVIDEAGNLSKFPLAVKLYTIGAGMGIRPWCIFQSVDQIEQLGPSAKPILLSSAATRQFFGIRDFDTAQTVSQMIGAQTLHYDDTARQAEATLAKRRAAFAMMNGQDPMVSAMEIRHHAQAETRQSKQARQLRTPAEVLQTPEAMQYIFADKVGAPIYCEKRAYYEQRFMSGRFFPNPYHPPINRVRVKTIFGHRWRHVIEDQVPPNYADYPQYAHGHYARLSAPGRKERN